MYTSLFSAQLSPSLHLLQKLLISKVIDYWDFIVPVLPFYTIKNHSISFFMSLLKSISLFQPLAIKDSFWPIMLQCIKEFLPYMMRIDRGHIVCINSMLGLMGLNGAADYSSSKFALTGFMESLNMEIKAEGKKHVYTTSVHPYLIDTDMFMGCKTR